MSDRSPVTTTSPAPWHLPVWPSLIDVMSSTNRVVTLSSLPSPKPKPARWCRRPACLAHHAPDPGGPGLSVMLQARSLDQVRPANMMPGGTDRGERRQHGHAKHAVRRTVDARDQPRDSAIVTHVPVSNCSDQRSATIPAATAATSRRQRSNHKFRRLSRFVRGRDREPILAPDRSRNVCRWPAFV